MSETQETQYPVNEFLVQGECGICCGSLKANGWGGVSAYMSISGPQARKLYQAGLAAIVITFHGQNYAPLPVCAKCLFPEYQARQDHPGDFEGVPDLATMPRVF